MPSSGKKIKTKAKRNLKKIKADNKRNAKKYKIPKKNEITRDSTPKYGTKKEFASNQRKASPKKIKRPKNRKTRDIKLRKDTMN